MYNPIRSFFINTLSIRIRDILSRQVENAITVGGIRNRGMGLVV